MPQLFLLYPNQREHSRCTRKTWGRWVEKKGGMFRATKTKVNSISITDDIYPIWDTKDLLPESKSMAGKVMDNNPLCTLPKVFEDAVPLTKNNVTYATKLMLITFQDACKTSCKYGKNGVTRYAAYVLNSEGKKEDKNTYTFTDGNYCITLKVSSNGVIVTDRSKDIRINTNVTFPIGTFWILPGLKF